MTTIVQHSYTFGRFSSLLVPLRRLYDGFIAARQRQADRRIALYIRDLPADVLLKHGVSVAELERLHRD